MYASVLTCCVLVLALHATEAGGPRRGLCSSLPELYYANIAGRIDGGVDTVSVGDQTLCSDRTFIDLRYRQIDGRCNHPKDYGSTLKAVKRYLRPHYQDRLGHNTPRMYSVFGGMYLPSPRLVSWKLHPDQSSMDNHTMWVMQLGQLIDHDITSAPVPTEANRTIKCCDVPSEQLPSECFPIPVTDGDPSFTTCMEFVRSEAAHDEDGNMIYPREQMNALTSFVDGSSIYGNDEKTMNELRSDKGVYLKTQIVDGKERLPRDHEAPSHECIAARLQNSYCQLAGDKRVNEQPALGSIHTMFHLNHNHIARLLVAGILKKRGQPATRPIIDKFIDDAPAYLREKLFQETKKIVGGILQKVVYCDWMPVILGPELIEKFKLGCERRSKYNPYVDPRVANGFLTAAFRFGHTLIPNQLLVNNKKQDIKDMFMIPDHSLQHYDSIIEGMGHDGSEEPFDRFVSTAVTNHLFESRLGAKKALDLVALNIQRGRDHGIPAYYYWRRYYGLRRITRLEELGDGGNDLKSVYRHILDVDLFTGGLLEKSVPGGMVGETFGHILANQFADLKYGDAHFFLSKEVPQGFTSDQLQAILRVTLSNIICRNAEVPAIQVNPFLTVSNDNPKLPCSSFPDLDVEPWMLYF